MKRSRYIAYPFLILLLILLLDKIALIPAVWEAGRGPITPIENLVDSLNSHIASYAERKKRGAERRPLVLFFGSSRSELFRHLTETNIRSAPGLSHAERERLLSIYFEPRMAYKAADMFIQMVMIEKLLETGVRPDLTILEFSPEMLNSNGPASIGRYVEESIFTVPYLIRILPILQGAERREVLNRLLFTSYAGRFRPERALSALFEDSRTDATQEFARAYLSGRPPVEKIPSDYTDFESGSIPKKEFEERFLGYTAYLKRDFVLRDYSIHPSELLSLYRILDLAQREGLPIAVWTPIVHPILEASWKQTEFAGRTQEIEDKIKERRMPFVRGSDLRIGCSRFVDSSHLSARCAPHLALALLKASGFID